MTEQHKSTLIVLMPIVFQAILKYQDQKKDYKKMIPRKMIKNVLPAPYNTDKHYDDVSQVLRIMESYDLVRQFTHPVPAPRTNSNNKDIKYPVAPTTCWGTTLKGRKRFHTANQSALGNPYEDAHYDEYSDSEMEASYGGKEI